MRNYFDRYAECMPREELGAVQLDRLQRTVAKVYKNVEYFRERMQRAGVKPGDIQTLADISKLPFMTKQDLRDHYPFGTFSAPMDEIIRIHASSGTTGKPTVVGYTQNDIATWGQVAARSLVAVGASKKSIIQNAYGYGLFTGGLGIHYGAELLGSAIIPISGGNTQRQIMMLADFGAELLTCTPSYALYLAEAIKAAGLKPGVDINLKYGVFGAEPWSEGMRRQIEEGLGLRAHDIYGLSEIAGPGVAIECEFQNSLHVWEDHYYPEVVDRDTLEPLPDGEVGELVFTTITKEGIPLIRYRTRDLSALYHEPCECGRTHVRMARILGRSDDMLIIRGVNVFPGQIESVLVGFKELTPNYMIIVERVNNLDDLTVKVEMASEYLSDDVKGIEKLQRRITSALYSVLGINANVVLAEPMSIARSEGKAKRVDDRRII